MAATSSSSKPVQQLITKLEKTYPFIAFQASNTFYWNPRQQIVCYNPSDDSVEAQWSLLHELCHALLEHKTYRFDLELLLIEAAAWSKAIELQKELNISKPIDDDHIQDCLDTYRDWLYSRSTCPTCDQVGLQEKPGRYNCINCSVSWHVSSKRFSRPYRLCSSPNIKTSSDSTAKQMKFY